MSVDLAYFKIINNIGLLPIRGVSFCDVDNSDKLHLFQLESESSWTITPIQRQTSQGTPITLAHRAELTLYPMLNFFGLSSSTQALTVLLDSWKNKEIYTQLLLGNVDSDKTDWRYKPADGAGGLTYPLNSSLLTKSVNSTGSMVLNFGNMRFQFEFEYVEFRPRAIIRLYAIIKQLNSISFTEIHTSPFNKLFLGAN